MQVSELLKYNIRLQYIHETRIEMMECICSNNRVSFLNDERLFVITNRQF